MIAATIGRAIPIAMMNFIFLFGFLADMSESKGMAGRMSSLSTSVRHQQTKRMAFALILLCRVSISSENYTFHFPVIAKHGR
ncbi:hypothetical protein CEXT_566771 [Caerostris extrusa]|uniref:Secreted protein n=1 Tax=Caerostris extrusa TaxID=172846 RepID=A0AAV4NCD6_CAEEX|nr:hypothetical protein CEXT_566771 [Caerostris extrusa]